MIFHHSPACAYNVHVLFTVTLDWLGYHVTQTKNCINLITTSYHNLREQSPSSHEWKYSAGEISSTEFVRWLLHSPDALHFQKITRSAIRHFFDSFFIVKCNCPLTAKLSSHDWLQTGSWCMVNCSRLRQHCVTSLTCVSPLRSTLPQLTVSSSRDLCVRTSSQASQPSQLCSETTLLQIHSFLCPLNYFSLEQT